MATGERIRFFRTLRGMTQKYLGMLLGFPPTSADVRMAQYESEDRNPKADLTAQMAQIFGVSPHAISVPDIDSYVGLMHTLFTLEDRYGLYVEESEGDVCLRVNLRASRRLNSIGCFTSGRQRPMHCGRVRSPRKLMTTGAIMSPMAIPPGGG